MEVNGWVTVATFQSLPAAELASGRLEADDIPAIIDQRDNLGIFGPGHAGGTVRGIALMVPEDRAAEARFALDLESLEE